MVSRYAEGFADRLPALAEEIVGLKPDVIVAAAVNAAVPAHTATSVIPIVCPALADPSWLGRKRGAARRHHGDRALCRGIARQADGVRREIVPGATRVGLLTNLQDQKARPRTTVTLDLPSEERWGYNLPT